MKLIKYLAAAAVLFGTGAVQAAPIVTLSAVGELYTSKASAIQYTFDTAVSPYMTSTGDFQILGADISGQSARPAGSLTNFLSVPNPNQNGSATFGLGFAANYFGMLWGSVDTYNSIAFYNGGTQIATYGGADLFAAYANGNQQDPLSNRYVNFEFGNGEVFDTIVLSSNGFAFESDNHAFVAASSVPEPAAALLMLLGIAGIRARRSRKA